MECVNCGGIGHSFRDCKSPVMSYGVVAVKIVDGLPKYLLIQRRDSMSYVEFLRGKYRSDDNVYITLLIAGMTADEHKRLLSQPFDMLWTNLWNSQNNRQYRNEYELARRQYEALKNTGDTYGKLLAVYIEENKSIWSTPEWGFPKGRRNSYETPLTCAIREFTEETGLAKKTIHFVKDIDAYVEQYVGTNGITYKQTYFLATCTEDVSAHLETSNRIMTREVGDISWLSYDEALARIRTTNPEKRAMLTRIHSDVTTRHKDKFGNEWTVVGTR